MNRSGGGPADDEAERMERVYGRYSAGKWDLANPGYRRLVEERREALFGVLREAGFAPLGDRRVLDVGCGFGGELAELTALGAKPANLVGVDLLADRVEAARRAHPGIDYRVGNAVSLDFEDASFDLLLSYTVFSSILDPEIGRKVAAEMSRVLRPGGAILWYDIRYPSPSNRNVRALGAGDVAALFPALEPSLRSISLLPPLARRLGPTAAWSYPLLTMLPPLRSHLLGLLRKPRPNAS